MSVTCDTSPHQSTEACKRTQDLFQRGSCVDLAGIELHVGVSLLCVFFHLDITIQGFEPLGAAVVWRFMRMTCDDNHGMCENVKSAR